MRDQADFATESNGLWGRIGRAAGAVMSVALLVILGLWLWRMGTQDVTQVPIIMAQAGPARVQPEDPGGTVAPHQGLEVNEVIAGDVREVGPEDVTLAPDPMDPEIVTAALPQAVIEVPAADEESEVAEDEEPVDPAAGRALPNAPVVSIVPRGRPGGLEPGRRPAPEPEQPVAIEADAIDTGAHMIQLGAFDSEQVALLQWAGILDAQPDLLTGKLRYIEQTTSGGRTLYRLRAVGFDSETETRAACAALVARGLQCIPVQKR